MEFESNASVETVIAEALQESGQMYLRWLGLRHFACDIWFTPFIW